MSQNRIFIKTLEDLKNHLKTHVPSLYVSSTTSTVIPFEKIAGSLTVSKIVDLSGLKGELAIIHESNGVVDETFLRVKGHVTWKEAKEFARSNGFEIMTSPTEELAGVLAGIATSCTGERSFGFGNLRSQVHEIVYLDFEGNEKNLSAKNIFQFSNLKLHEKYKNDFLKFKQFKNAPFPRLEAETDIMIGFEGQLGVIVEAKIKLRKYKEETYLFFKLPKWTEDFSKHLELYQKVQNFRHRVFACELIDHLSLSYIPKEENPSPDHDLIFMEIAKADFDSFCEDFLSTLETIKEEDIFEMTPSKCRALRVLVPRSIFEVNSQMGVTKKGTDVQVGRDHFKDLLEFYRDMTKLGVDCNMFGHFGDAHLHFNFMPKKDQEEFCLKELDKLYAKVLEWQGSPFAEHGIGLLKRKFITPFYNDTQKLMFNELKLKMDPHKQFFPEGFML